jgi:hypothetical protein
MPSCCLWCLHVVCIMTNIEPQANSITKFSWCAIFPRESVVHVFCRKKKEGGRERVWTVRRDSSICLAAFCPTERPALGKCDCIVAKTEKGHASKFGTVFIASPIPSPPQAGRSSHVACLSLSLSLPPLPCLHRRTHLNSFPIAIAFVRGFFLPEQPPPPFLHFSSSSALNLPRN